MTERLGVVEPVGPAWMVLKVPACPRGFALRELCRVSTAGGGVIDNESLALLYLLQERT